MALLGTYFTDMSDLKMRTRKEVEERIAGYKEAIENTSDKKAQEVWYNLMWENEWFIGKRA